MSLTAATLLGATSGCAGDGPIPGDPDAPLAGSLPALRFDADLASYRTGHPELPGVELSVDTAIVVFRVEATIGAANDVLSRVGAEIVGVMAGAPGAASDVLVVRLPTTTHEDMEAALATLAASPDVELAVQDAAMEPARIPRSNGGTPPGWDDWNEVAVGPNWGLEELDMPQLWNLRPHARTTKVALFELALPDRMHPDLTRVMIGDPAHHDPEWVAGPPVDDHATHVAGTIAADFDNQLGVDGACPDCDVLAYITRTFAEASDRVSSLPDDAPVVNVSLQYARGSDRALHPANHPPAALHLRGMAVAFHLALRARVGRGAPLPFVVAAAGNDVPPDGAPTPYAIRDCSPFGYAGTELRLANVLVVGALATDESQAAFSCTGGHVLAPGTFVTSTITAGRYGEMSGTSMAAPHVAGALGYLLALLPDTPRPTLAESVVADAMRRTAEPVAGSTTPRLVPYRAFAEIGGEAFFRLVADIDDGTLDGNDRNTLADMPDGVVDMADFRRFRDFAHDHSVDPLSVHLDGDPMHPKRDVNGDGDVGGLDYLYARGDLNFDAIIHASRRNDLPGLGEVTDLQVMQAVFDDPDYEARELDALLESGDLLVDATACLGYGEVVSTVIVDETDERLGSRSHSDAEPRRIYTLEPSVPMTARLEVRAPDGTVVHVEERGFALAPLEDQTFDPVCGFILTELAPPAGVVGDVIEVRGGGFVTDLALVDAFFEDPTSGTILPAAVVDAVRTDRITAVRVRVPAGVDVATAWDVYLVQGPPDLREASNRLSFRAGAAVPSPTVVATGFAHSCVLPPEIDARGEIRVDPEGRPVPRGDVWCWGRNSNYQLGHTGGMLRAAFGGDAWVDAVPRRVAGIDDAVSVSAGFAATCVLRRSGRVACFGGEPYGDGLSEHGPCPLPGSVSCAATPSAVAGLVDAIAVSVSSNHACALRRRGEVVCWGWSQSNLLGGGRLDPEWRTSPEVVPGVDGATSFDAGRYDSCAARFDGSILCWGRESAPGVPDVYGPIADVVDVQLGDDSLHVLTADGAVYVTSFGRTLHRATDAMGIPLAGVDRIAVSPLDNDRCVVSFGIASCDSSPVTVDDAVGVSLSADVRRHHCVLRRDGVVLCWGHNDHGQLGDGGFAERIDTALPTLPLGP